MSFTVEPQIVAQGSFGIYRINRFSGRPLGQIIKVWHVKRGERIVSTWSSRRAARLAMAEEKRRLRED